MDASHSPQALFAPIYILLPAISQGMPTGLLPLDFDARRPICVVISQISFQSHLWAQGKE